MKVKDEEHTYQSANPEKVQKLQKFNILQKHWDYRTGYPLLFLDYRNKSTQQLKANNRKLTPFSPSYLSQALLAKWAVGSVV